MVAVVVVVVALGIISGYSIGIIHVPFLHTTGTPTDGQVCASQHQCAGVVRGDSRRHLASCRRTRPVVAVVSINHCHVCHEFHRSSATSIS